MFDLFVLRNALKVKFPDNYQEDLRQKNYIQTKTYDP